MNVASLFLTAFPAISRVLKAAVEKGQRSCPSSCQRVPFPEKLMPPNPPMYPEMSARGGTLEQTRF